jgi:hypothetical protein
MPAMDNGLVGDDWLNGRVIVCTSCGYQLYRVDHSPFDDGWLLYCDRCPRRVDVSFYDPVVRQIEDDLRASGSMTHQALMVRVAARLRPCDCGGRYRNDAPRRCVRCFAHLQEVTPASGVDVWPAWPNHEPTDAELAEQQAFISAFVRSDDLWEAT